MEKTEQKSIFKQFVSEMNKTIADYKDPNYLRNQASLFNAMFDAETGLRECLQSTEYGRSMYKIFMDYIVNEKGSTIQAMPYFRERQKAYSNKISKAFKKGDPKLLFQLKINYVFATWVVKNWKHSPDGSKPVSPTQFKKIKRYYQVIVNKRKQLCEQSLTLALNRARLFYSKVPEKHLDFMDLVQNSSEGLLTAIDKFSPPYKTVWRTTAIGRMTLNMIVDYNSTMVKISPNDRRILYRFGLAKSKSKNKRDKSPLEFVNESFSSVTQDHLNVLVAAAQCMTSYDNSIDNSVLAPPVDPESHSSKRQVESKVFSTYSELETIERKVVTLKTGY